MDLCTSLAWHRGRAGRTGQPPAGSWVFTWQTEAEGRLWGVTGADTLVPAACLALMPPAARRGRALLPPRAACAACGWRAAPCLHVFGEAVHAISSDLVSRLAGTRSQPPAPSPAPTSSHCPVWPWPLAGSIGPLTRCQHSPPANFAPSLIPLTSSPCAKPCAQAGLLPRENRSCERGREPLGSDRPTPQPCRSPAGGPRPSCCAARVSSLWL